MWPWLLLFGGMMARELIAAIACCIMHMARCCRYPYNLDFDYGALDGLNQFSINNLGDPFIESNYGVHSREFEVGVLNW